MFIFTIIFTIILFFFMGKLKKMNSNKLKLSEIEKNEQSQKAWLKKLENDKERITPSQVEELITKLNISQNILTIFRGLCNDEIMKKYYLHTDYSVPEVLYLTKQEQDGFFIDRYLPILSRNEKIFVYDHHLKGFNWYYLETGIENESYCYTWDALFIPEIVFWWESEISDDDILYIGKYMGLKYVKEILDSIYNTTGGKGFSTSKILENWEEKIMKEINGIILS